MSKYGVRPGRPARLPVSKPTMSMEGDEIVVTWSGPKPASFVMSTKALELLVAETNRSRKAALAAARLMKALKVGNTTPKRSPEAEVPAPEVPPPIAS